MEEKRCTGDCLKCSLQQQVYCAAQHGHVIFASLGTITERLSRIETALVNLSPSGEIINPIKEDAQGGAGAENRAPSL